ncbi:hypothetical protein G9A89_006013 [Geosiphon pyriformis]|nr:hypothetical protein G9A89_006013 [Geosiphon pyriformis]
MPIGEIDNFPIEVNGIVTPIKVLVMKATHQNKQHTQVPAICGHFKTTNSSAPLIDFEEKKTKPIWKAYQVSWTDPDHNKLLLILSWNDNPKRKQKEELT